CYLAPMLRWSKPHGGGPDWFNLDQWPRLKAFAQRTEIRDAAQSVALAEGLGPTPFSSLSPCNPPEESAP
ncbi:MAG: glutathione S-transferase, partial [Yoonia sp.]